MESQSHSCIVVFFSVQIYEALHSAGPELHLTLYEFESASDVIPAMLNVVPHILFCFCCCWRRRCGAEWMYLVLPLLQYNDDDNDDNDDSDDAADNDDTNGSGYPDE